MKMLEMDQDHLFIGEDETERKKRKENEKMKNRTRSLVTNENDTRNLQERAGERTVRAVTPLFKKLR